MKKSNLLLAIVLFMGVTGIRAQSPYSGMGYGKPSQCTPAANYHFKGQMDMQISTKEKGKDTSISKFTSYFGDSGKMIAMIRELKLGKPINAITIMNLKDSQVISLMDLGKMKFASCSKSPAKMILDSISQPKKDIKGKGMHFKNFKETGKTKKICGYTCKEYFMSNDTASMSIWICNDLTGVGLAGNDLSGNTGDSDYLEGIKGLTMEFVRTDKKTNKTTQMLVTAIDLNAEKDISTEGYTLR